MSSFFYGLHYRAEEPVQQCKARDQNYYPHPEDNEYSEWAVETKKSLSFVFNCILHSTCMDRPMTEKSGQKKRQIRIPVRGRFVARLGLMTPKTSQKTRKTSSTAATPSRRDAS
jgi:hypothetical protein